MLLWLFKQLARGSYRDRLLIETPRLAKLGYGWEMQIGLLPRVQMQPKSQPPHPTPPPTPFSLPPPEQASHKHPNMTHWRAVKQVHSHSFMSKDWSLQKEKDVKKCEMKTCDLFTALSPPCVTPRMVTRAWRLHWRSNDERAEEGR